ncbi:MAG: MFS transporter, partial [Acidimicrobiales bacterium]|nr:MFS transporter [Acidimicrobiales bacterium]
GVLADDRASTGRRRLDLPGAALATLGLASLTYGITLAHTRGWRDPGTGPALVLGTTAVIAFVVVEARWAPSPIVPLRLFRQRAVSAGNVAMLLAGACLMPMWYFLSLFMQDVLHYGALRTGMAFLPHTLVTMAVGWSAAPRLMAHVEARTLVVAGALVAAAGFLWQSRVTPETTYVQGLLGPAIAISIGAGLLNTPLTATVTSGTRRSDAGAAAGVMNTTKQVGGALGLAVLVTIAGRPAGDPGAMAAAHGRAFFAIAVVLVAVAAVATTLPGGGGGPAPPEPGTDRPGHTAANTVGPRQSAQGLVQHAR